MINRSIVQEGNILRLVLAYASQGSETADSWVRFCQKPPTKQRQRCGGIRRCRTTVIRSTPGIERRSAKGALLARYPTPLRWSVGGSMRRRGSRLSPRTAPRCQCSLGGGGRKPTSPASRQALNSATSKRMTLKRCSMRSNWRCRRTASATAARVRSAKSPPPTPWVGVWARR